MKISKEDNRKEQLEQAKRLKSQPDAQPFLQHMLHLMPNIPKLDWEEIKLL